MQNCWVVPYSPYLLARYDAHINVEICANVKACKYIFNTSTKVVTEPVFGSSKRTVGYQTV